MAIERKTASQFATDLEAAVLSRNNTYDTKIGPVRDLVIQPLANVLELQNERTRAVQQLLSLVNDGSFTDADLDSFVFNELLIRLPGGESKVNLIFSRVSLPTVDITIKANFPVATLPDEETGNAITYLTLVDTTLIAANAASYFNTSTQRYELQVEAESLSSSSTSNVAANRVTRPLRALNGFDTVFNRDASTGGTDTETNTDLINRYYLSLLGTSPSVVNGIQKILRDKFQDVLDSNIVFGGNPLNTRSSTDGGAVDVYTIGTTATTTLETIVFPGTLIIIPLTKQPLMSLTSVIGVSPATTYIQNTDFILVKDITGLANSVRALDGIKWLATGTVPAIGASVNVTYIYNALEQQLQDAFTADDKNVPSRDILFKEASQVNITLSANVKIRNGFNVNTVTTAINVAILSFINALKLNNDVELSDIQAIVRSFTGVDNFVVTNIAKLGYLGTVDILISDNEYVRMDQGDLILTVI